MRTGILCMDEDGFISTGRPEEIASLQALQPSALQLGKLLRNMFCLVWLCGQGQRRASHPNPGETLICRRCLLRQSLTKHLCLPLLHDLPHSHSLSLSLDIWLYIILCWCNVFFSDICPLSERIRICFVSHSQFLAHQTDPADQQNLKRSGP